MKLVRTAALLLGIPVLLVLAVAGYIAATFDTAWLKSELSRQAETRYQRSLRIEGDLKLSFYPSLGVELGQATLSEPGSDVLFASLDSAHVAVRLRPLLSRRVVVDGVEIDGLKANLIRFRDGRLNIADLINQDNAKREEPASPLGFDVAGIRVSRSRLEWRDQTNGQVLVLGDLGLSTGQIARQARGPLSFGASLDGGKSGKARLDVLGNYVLDLDRRQAAIEQLDLKVGAQGGGGQMDLTIATPRLAWAASQLGAESLSVAITGQTGNKTFKAELASPMTFDIGTSRLALSGLKGAVNLGLPDAPVKVVSLPLQGDIRADFSARTASTRLDTRFDGAVARIGAVAKRFEPFAFSVDLQADALDADKYLSAPATGKAAQVDARIDLTGLKALDMTGSLRIDKLKLKNIRMERFRLAMRAAGGRIELSPHSANLYGGSVSGSLSLDAATNRLVLKEQVEGVDLKPLLADALGKDSIQGLGSMALDVVAQGATVTQLRQSLSGNARLRITDGALRGINLAQALRVAKARLGGGQDTVQQARAEEKTDFSELNASFSIQEGVAHGSDLSAKSPFLRLGGAGDIDIGRGRMDYLARATVVASTTGQGGDGLDALRGVTVPVRVSGPFDNLTYRLEIGTLMKEAVREKADAAGQKIKQKVEDRVRDKLRDLLGK